MLSHFLIFHLIDVDEADQKFCSRKRTRNSMNNKAYVRKQKFQSGKSYKTKSGKFVPERLFAVQIDCTCKYLCAQKINTVRQGDIFKAFYELENWSKKTIFLRSLVKKHKIQSNLNPINKLHKKNDTGNEYYLSDKSGTQHRVCPKFVLKCLQISQSRLSRAVNSVISNESGKDKRGSFPTRKIDAADIDFLKSFINKFPVYESHYNLSRSKKKYLSPYWNQSRMYREYRLICEHEKKKVLKECTFRRVFNTQFNLSFHSLVVDSCKTCDKFKVALRSKSLTPEKRDEILRSQKNHLTTANMIREDLKKCVEENRVPNKRTVVLTFDLQRALEIPSIHTNVAYYKRQLWFFNLCVYDEIKKEGFMYVWDESFASRGSQEISSCLYRHFLTYVPIDTEKIILYSDACGGQNRNIKMSLMLKKFIADAKLPNLECIEQRFFMSGHSYNNCDGCFGLIERQRKLTEDIFVPAHWVNVIRQSKKDEPKFNVIEMLGENFFSSKNLENLITNRKKTTDGEKINWFHFQCITYNRNDPYILSIREYSLENESNFN